MILPATTRVLNSNGVLRPVGGLQVGERVHTGGFTDLWAEVEAVRDVGELLVLRLGLESLRWIFLPPAQRVVAPNLTAWGSRAAELSAGHDIRAFVWGFVRVVEIESAGPTKCVELTLDGLSLWDPQSDVVLATGEDVTEEDVDMNHRKDIKAYRSDGVPMRSSQARALERATEIEDEPTTSRLEFTYDDWQQPLSRCKACGRVFTAHATQVCLLCRKKEQPK